ncbi:tetratricopeptide repeat protein [Azospirillum picis]|uniref:Tetratricopeptide (TPR) repeat protein n=1 Tax=Azospirillum picis TaxID=488438 RepID=A0ABU0MTJ5_9PROT|nr:tetratricopeptide repeat-containing glycosyltransferase family protein [Azospirillum picis]MBP2303076.1 tetratricopeptide (TPR) repeat protein [Azospirillum picis]MDQ0536810.1 tetratricopeptide (TPR) repeat protein [Azospirillum picis]
MASPAQPPVPPATETQQTLEHALALLQAGRAGEAEALCRTLLSRQPQDADGHHLHGVAALASKHLDEAAARIARAVALAPQVARFYTNLGTAQQGGGRSEPAERSYCHALRLAPDQAETRFNLGNLLVSAARLQDAEAAYQSALALQPARGKYWANLGKLRLRQQRHVETLRAYAIADQAPGGPFPESDVNRGMAHQRLNQLPQALACYERALAAFPDNASAHWNRALALLLSGRLQEGWEEYEWRWRLADSPPRGFAQPLWSGQPLADRTLLLHAEQGLGDTLQFVRYLPLVAARVKALVLECQPPLRRLLADSFPGVTVVAAGEALPDFDVQAPLLSLPRLFATTLDAIPGAPPYLLAANGRTVPPPRPGTLAVALVWGGDPSHRNDQQRSLDAAALAELLGLPGVTFYSVQKGARAGQLAEAVAGAQLPTGHIVDLGPEIGDFADTAAILQRMDRVVTVDTSVAHLAGALHVPVDILLPYSPDWRWLLERADSPWYPAATLFRQAAPGEWGGVIRSLASHLSRIRSVATAHPGRYSR